MGKWLVSDGNTTTFARLGCAPTRDGKVRFRTMVQTWTQLNLMVVWFRVWARERTGLMVQFVVWSHQVMAKPISNRSKPWTDRMKHPSATPKTVTVFPLSLVDQHSTSLICHWFVPCTLLPPPRARGPQVLSSSPPLSSTTTNSSRFDSLSIYLGWLHCCTPLPPLRADLKSCRHHPPYLAQPPTRADSTHRLSVLVGYIVVPHFLLSMPMNLKSCHRHSSYLAQPPTQADSTCHRSVLVGYIAVPHYHSPRRSQYLAIVSNSLLLSLCCCPQSFAIVSDTFLLLSPIFCHCLQYFSIIAPCTLYATHLLIIFIFFIWYMIFYSCIRHLTDTCF